MIIHNNNNCICAKKQVYVKRLMQCTHFAYGDVREYISNINEYKWEGKNEMPETP